MSADTTQSRAIQFSDWLIEPHLNRISRDGEEKQLEPKTMDVLAYLVEHAGDVVSQDALLQRFWPGRVVEESTVHRRINQIRRVLGDEARHPVYIETISRRGYRAIAPVTVLPVKEEKEAESRSELQSRTPPFPAYEGDEPYVFVCYAHRDRQTVYPELVRLRDAEVNVWYDEGISPGSEWTDELAKAIEGCDQFLYFVSPAAVQSENCRSEVRFALNHAKPLVTVYLEPTELPGGLELSIALKQALFRYELPTQDYERKLLSALGGDAHGATRRIRTAPVVRSRQIRWSLTTAGIVLLTTLVLITAGWWFSSPGGVPEQGASSVGSIAVLPFVNLSADPEQEYFADGLSEELINQLAKIPHLRVAGRTSSFAFKDKTPGFDVIGEALGVEHVLEGSVRRAGDELRITAQLISVVDGFNVWSQAYDRELEDVFAIQQEIATAVARALSLELGVSTSVDGGTKDPTAYAHYLRSRALFINFAGSLYVDRGIGELQQAIDIDPDFALAWVQLSYWYGARARDPAQTEKALADMAAAAARAVALAPDLWEAQAARGWVLLSYRDFVAADRAFDRAAELAKLVGAHTSVRIASYLQQVGRMTEAVAEARLVQRMDPLAPGGSPAGHLYMLGRREEALAEVERNRGVQAGIYNQPLELWLAMEQSDPSRMNEILASYAQELGPDPFGRLAGLWGSPDEVLSTLRQALDSPGPYRRGALAFWAIVAAHHGDAELALEFLRAEYLVDGFGAYFLIWHPELREVRTTPGFRSFVRDLGLVELWRTTGKWGDFCRPVGDDDFECA